MIIIRAATERDLAAIAEIQFSAPEASQWSPEEYLDYDCRVAEQGTAVVGFLVARTVGSEAEILNLAVAFRSRRQGIGRQLIGDLLARHRGEVFLEVRESNQAAQQFYEHLGFRVVTKRAQYYADTLESAIVMKLYSC